MLGNLFGKNQNSGPPKNQVEVVCPICGASQYEPRLVVTTFCRSCGEHLRIEKKKVVASSRINPVPSALYPAVNESAPQPPREPPKPSDFRERQPASSPQPAEKREPEVAAKDVGSSPPSDLDAPLGLGQMMLSLNPGPSPSPATEEEEIPAPKPYPKVEAEEDSSSRITGGGGALQRIRQRLATPPSETPANEAPPPQGPMSSSTLQKMKEQGYYRQQYFKDVECFDCQHKFKVGRSSKSTNCPSCGGYICLEDFDINVPSTTPIRTRGDVIIRKNGNISTSEIRCRDLRIYGTVAAQIECSGELILRMSGTVIGEIHCRKFVVEKGSDIHFINTIHAQEVDVQARVFGNIRCDGPVNISSHGWVHGDVTARSVSIEPGGQLDGAMNIVRSSTPRPPSSSYDKK